MSAAGADAPMPIRAEDVVATVRAAKDGSVVPVLDGGGAPLPLAMALAAIGPLAVERAPATRVNAVVAEPGASLADVAAAVAFLHAARSTTGQVLRVDQPRVRPHGPSCSSTKP